MKIDYQKVLQKIMHTKGLVIILLVGVFLLILPGSFTKKEADKSEGVSSLSVNYAAYEKDLEKRLVKILSTLSGISHVNVMVTVEDAGEITYARNDSTEDVSQKDGAMLQEDFKAEGELALKNNAGGGQSPVLLKTGLPKVSGVLVTARGLDSINKQNEVILAVSAVLDVPTHRVKALAKES